MGLLNTITNGKSGDAAESLDRALQAIQGVSVPDTEDLQFRIEKLVESGVLSPEQARTYLQSPSAFATQDIDQTGARAQGQSIADLLNAAHAGGLSPEGEDATQQITRDLNTQEKGQRDAILQNQAARGALTSGQTLAAQLEANQTDASNANQRGLGTAADAHTQMLNELTSAGSLGGNLQGQKNAQGNVVSSAVDAINRFNTAQQQGQENLNVSNRNSAAEMNLKNKQDISNANTTNTNNHALQQSQIPQSLFEDNLAKASAEAGAYGNKSNLEQNQGQQTAALIAPAASFMGFGVNPRGGQGNSAQQQTQYDPESSGFNSPGNAPGFSDGGEINFRDGGQVPGHAMRPGDSPSNDTVPAVLSPGEVVLPRSVAQNPQPDRVMGFLNRMRGHKSAHPDDVASVLHALGRIREVA